MILGIVLSILIAAATALPTPPSAVAAAPPQTLSVSADVATAVIVRDGYTVADPPPPPPRPTLPVVHRAYDGNRAAAIAREYLGVPYVFGGSSRSGVDCSGLVMVTLGRLGVTVPHSVEAQARRGKQIPAGAARPGDLVVFAGYEHIGIYLGGGQMIHAPYPGASVRIGGWNSSATFVKLTR